MSLPVITCTHQQQVTFCRYVNCMLCGAILSQPSSTHTLSNSGSYEGVVKDDLFNVHSDIPTSLLYSTMLNDQYTARYYNPTAQYVKVRNNCGY